MSHTVNNITIICYDFTSNKLRRKVDKVLKDFGTRLQYSVFLCRIDGEGVERCRNKLIDVLTEFRGESSPEDSLIIFDRLHPERADTLLGTRIAKSPSPFEIL